MAPFIAPTLQREHGYIILVVVLVVFVNFWAGFKVGAARKRYNIKYPQNFVEFNCVQRAHQNVLENLPVFLALLFVSSYVSTTVNRLVLYSTN
ncbi:hypothetical protein DYB25_001905 [Aphanomyces astaci]|uniref:Uncharacterized protein n=1 Tax=Aphanomyces astaci TaxID=112090 RepID=A0A397BUS4_APHAT|nr:hypothetical protein DYB36_005138 [Aphanomyces astaci]RHY25344.1 hypothetical protein DYB25_001905 [Aphanomyces astaci]RHZ07874.1 hypothetical protein DYB31_009756 [Aphanomyces astaci]